MSARPSWTDLCERYPELTYIETLARNAGKKDIDTYDCWYREVKPVLVQTVGTMSRDYDPAYQYLFRAYWGEAL